METNMQLKKILILLVITIFCSLVYANGNMTSFELGAGMYRNLTTDWLGNHWHGGIYTGFSYEQDTKRGVMKYKEMDYNGHFTPRCQTEKYKKILDLDNLGVSLAQLKDEFINHHNDDDDLQHYGFSNGGAYRGAYSRDLSAITRSDIVDTAGNMMRDDIGYCFMDMIQTNLIWQSWPPGWYESWNGKISRINDMRCDAVVEYSYEKNDVMVAMNDNITHSGMSHMHAHNNLHGGSTNPGSEELCPRIQAGDRGNASTFEPLEVENPILKEFSVNPHSGNLALEVAISDNASVKAYLSIEVSDTINDDWKVIKSIDGTIWDFNSVELDEEDYYHNQNGLCYILWNKELEDGTFWNNSSENTKYRISIIDQGANYYQTVKLPASITGNVSVGDNSIDITDVSIFLNKHGSSEYDTVIHPDDNGDFSYIFAPGALGIYDIKYSLNTSSDNYYFQRIKNVTTDSYTVLEPITLVPVDFNNVVVTKNMSLPFFHTIQEAVNYVTRYGNESNTIKVFSGTYEEGISFTPISAISADRHIKITGTDKNTCIISGSVIFYSELVQYNSSDILENFTITDGAPALYLVSGSPLVKNVNIINSGNNNTISAIVINSSPTLDNCVVDNYDVPGELGGAIYIDNGTLLPAIIKNSEIKNCSAARGGAIYSKGTLGVGGVSLIDNYIHSNTIIDCPDPQEKGVALYFEDTYNLKLIGNIISNNSCPGDRNLIYLDNCDNTVIDNNTIVDNPNQTGILVDHCENTLIRSNIISGTYRGVNRIYGDPLTLSYNLINGSNYDYLGNITLGNGNIIGTGLTPFIDPQLDSNFIPRWDVDAKSVCIDAGYPGYLDSDDTRIDIGAKPTITHQNDNFVLYNYSSTRSATRFKWLSFPALDNRTAIMGNSQLVYDGDMAKYLLADVFDSSILDNVTWWEYGALQESVLEYEGNGIWENEDETFISTQGYIFEVANNLTSSVSLNVSGFKETSNTEISLKGGGKENWIGYFLDDEHTVKEAFSDVYENLTMIQTQKWAIAKDKNGNWVGDKILPLKYGDMVIVECINDCTFSWNNEGTTVPIEPLKSTAFTWEEEAQYIPIFIEVEETRSAPLEVAVLVNGECKGAGVVEEGEVTILAYILECQNEDVEFEFYYGERADNTIKSEYKMSDLDGSYVSEKISIDSEAKYYQVSFREEDDVVELPKNLSMSNYPNPFNPNTTISYALPEDSNVEITIFNVKGQKVTTLVNEAKNAGYHKSIWSGMDASGKPQSSGIYFYSLKTGNKIINKKMMLLK